MLQLTWALAFSTISEGIQLMKWSISIFLPPKTPAATCMVLQEYFSVKESEAHFINYIPLKFTPIVYCQSNSLSISKHGDQHLFGLKTSMIESSSSSYFFLPSAFGIHSSSWALWFFFPRFHPSTFGALELPCLWVYSNLCSTSMNSFFSTLISASQISHQVLDFTSNWTSIVSRELEQPRGGASRWRLELAPPPPPPL